MPQRKDLLLISVKSYRNRMCLGIGLKITIIIMMIITSIFVLFNLAALVEIIKCNLSKHYMVSIQLPCQFPYSWFKSPQPFWHKMNVRTRKLCFAGDYKLALMAGPSMLSLFITSSVCTWQPDASLWGSSGSARVSVAHPSWSYQAGCTRQKTWKSERKKAHHTLNQKRWAACRQRAPNTHILTFFDSIWHPSACSPSRPSPPCSSSSSWQPITMFWDAARRDTTPISG